MKSKTKLLCSLLLCIIMFLSVFRVQSSAAYINIKKEELSFFESIEDKNVNNYKKISVTLWGHYINDRAYLIKETTYIPLRAVTSFAGASVTYDAGTRTARVNMSGLSMTVSDGSYIVYANERPLIAKTPAVIMNDGKMYLPIRTLAKALGLTVTWQPPSSVALDGKLSPLLSALAYYRADDLLWLSRIINAESRGEPLLGQIAVGNVVMNRVRSREYPNTIYGVIFDRRYGVQFSPIVDGSIYLSPTYNSTLAAKICLEGFTVSEDILFFMEPTKSTSSWIVNNRPYEFTVQNHYFFS